MGLSRRQFTKEFKLPPYGGWGKVYQSRSSARRGSQSERAAPLAARIPGSARQRIPRQMAKQRWSEGRIAELERKIGQQALEIDFWKGCLQRIEEQGMLQVLTGNPPSTGRSKKK